MKRDSFYRRKLPHWRASGATYFVTWRLRAAQAELTANERQVVFDAIEHFDGDRYELVAYVVMNDHAHVLFAPSASRRVEDLVHTWKSFTANVLQRTTGRAGSIWQEEYFDRIIGDVISPGGHGGPPHQS